MLFSVYCDAEMLTRILSQDWVDNWEGWPRVQRHFREMGDARGDAIAGECAERVTKMSVANVDVACKSVAERKESFVELGLDVGKSGAITLFA